MYRCLSTGDLGEDVITITNAAPPFTIDGTITQVPAIDYVIGEGLVIPRVTVQVLHVLLAALTDTEVLSTFPVQDAPDNPVTITLTDGRRCTSHHDQPLCSMPGHHGRARTVGARPVLDLG